MPAKPKSAKAVRTPKISSMAKPAKAAKKKSQPIKAAAVTKKSAKTKPARKTPAKKVLSAQSDTVQKKLPKAAEKTVKAPHAKTKPSKGKAAETTAAITIPSGTASASPRIMLDLETFGNTPGAVIVSIGAVKFDESGILDRFYCRIDRESCKQYGLHEDESALTWWASEENKEALEEVMKPDGLNLKDALQQFATWVGNPKTEIWGHGSDFDNVLLASAYRACGMEPPWFYGFNRCYRTISRMHRNEVPFQGHADPKKIHHALDDAEAQALHLIEILKKCYGSKLSE